MIQLPVAYNIVDDPVQPLQFHCSVVQLNCLLVTVIVLCFTFLCYFLGILGEVMVSGEMPLMQ